MTLFHNLVLKGHGFSRAAQRPPIPRALAPEGPPRIASKTVWKQLLVHQPLADHGIADVGHLLERDVACTGYHLELYSQRLRQQFS